MSCCCSRQIRLIYYYCSVCVVSPSGLLPPPLYSKYVSPIIYRLFTVREFTIRQLLLTHFKQYAHELDKSHLQKYIMPQVSARPPRLPLSLPSSSTTRAERSQMETKIPMFVSVA